MRSLAKWQIDSMRQQHQRAIHGDSGFSPVSVKTEVRDDTEPGGRRVLTVEELAEIRAEVPEIPPVKPTADHDSGWSTKTPPTRADYIKARGMAHHLAMMICRIVQPMTHDQQQAVATACENAMRVQDELIARYREREFELAMIQPLPPFIAKKEK